MDASLTWLLAQDGSQLWIALALTSARCAPLAWLCPWLLPQGPTWLRLAVTLVVSLALLPAASAHAGALPSSPLGLAWSGLREVVIGLLFALVTSLPLFAMGWSGQLTDLWRGALGPDAGLHAGTLHSDAQSPLQQLLQNGSAALFLLLGAHLLALHALADSLATIPIGTPAHASSTVGGWRSLGLETSRLFAAALGFAARIVAPVAVILLLIDLSAGLVGRAVSGFAAYFVLMPVRAGTALALALLGLSLSFELLPEAFRASLQLAERMLGKLATP